MSSLFCWQVIVRHWSEIEIFLWKANVFSKVVYFFFFFEISAYKERKEKLLVLRCLVHYLSAQRLITLVSPFFYSCWWCLKIFWYYLNRLGFSFCGMYLPRHRQTNYSLTDYVSGWQLMSLNWNQQHAWNWCPFKSRALTHISLSHPGRQGLPYTVLKHTSN